MPSDSGFLYSDLMMKGLLGKAMPRNPHSEVVVVLVVSLCQTDPKVLRSERAWDRAIVAVDGDH